MTGAAVQILTLTEIDAELRFRAEEFDRITATLLELDKHPGLLLIRRFPPTGTTERAWIPVREALELMWRDHGRLRAILDSARTVRGTRARLDDADRAEVTRLLRGRPHELSRTAIPMAQRTLTGPSEYVLMVGLADTVDRMRATFGPIAEFLDAVDAVNTRIISGLGPVQDRLDGCGAAPGELPDIESGIADLLRRSATDPLELTPDEIDARVAELDAALRLHSQRLAEAAALRADWPAAVAETRAMGEALRATAERAARARAEVEAKISTGPLPPSEDAGFDPIAATAAVAESAVAAGAVAELVALRRRIAEAARRAAAEEDLYRGLLDRRTELRGRLNAYRAKAARLGVAEDAEALAAEALAAELLSRRPCDLAAVTRAVADYQRVIGAKSGRNS
ncbi:hypothetical protein [Nocardia arizonensis]|uniref:hypothetical protein n=1 Tax=Nocardia arizonensis TaxID=1141647 RepID=UPI0006CFC727|nr:hypothetical protein [Nocardia arizonensis]